MNDKTTRPLFPALVLMLLASLLFGCSDRAAEPGASDAEAQVVQIAADYGRDGDREAAANRLAALAVPNPRQYLAFLTESYITEGRNADVIASLVALARDLGLLTTLIAQYDAGHPAAVTPTAAPTQVLETRGSTPSQPTEPTATARPTATPTPTPTLAPTTLASTAQPSASPTPEPPTATPTSSAPRVHASTNVNLRAGPGTSHPVVSALRAGGEMPITGRTTDGNWWQVCCVGQAQAWVAASVVEGLGDVQTVAVVLAIPTPPPTLPPPPTSTPAPQAPLPTQAPPPTQAPSRPAIDFRIIEQRMLSNVENGGSFDGESLHCGLGHTIFIRVVDAAGNPLNGIVVRGIYFGDLPATGTKGPGMTSEDLFAGGGDELIIDRDTAGRTYSSEKTRGLVNRTRDIPIADYIAGGYCRDEADCQQKINNNQLCEGHYSWSVVFQRTW